MQRLEDWLAGYRLPDQADPHYEIEVVHLGILRAFYALLCLTGDSTDPLSAVRRHLPDFPEFPLHGSPSEALRVLGVARVTGPLVDLKNRLLDGLTAEQAAQYLVLSED